MTSQSSFLNEVLDRDAIYDTIFEFLPPRSLFRFGRASRLARSAVKDWTNRTWDINKHLRRYFTDPIGFRVLQAQTSAIISGSSALQFFDRSFYPESDLDLYVDAKQAAAVCSWIVEYGGRDYVFQPTEAQRKAGHHSYQDVIDGFVSRADENLNEVELYYEHFKATLNFRPRTHSSSQDKLIQVIVSDGSPMSTILDFHNTAVMNVLTYQAAYSFFPIETFERRRMMSFHNASGDGMAKYVRRGWTLFDGEIFATTSPFVKHEFRRGKRWVGDTHTWTLCFDTTCLMRRIRDTESAPSDSLPYDPYPVQSFSVASGGNKMTADFDIAGYPDFQHDYTMNPVFSKKLTKLLAKARAMPKTMTEDAARESNERMLPLLTDICKRHCRCELLELRSFRDTSTDPQDITKCKAFEQLLPLSEMLYKMKVWP